MKAAAFLIEAFQNLLLHKTRSALAVLGIIFGVASVICMNSISEVAHKDVVFLFPPYCLPAQTGI